MFSRHYVIRRVKEHDVQGFYKDEFEMRAARRAGYHAYLVGGLMVFLLVAAYRSSADPEEKERLRRRIRQRLAEKFDETIGRHARRLERLRSQLEEVEAELRFRTAHRDDIIDHQLDLLLGE